MLPVGHYPLQSSLVCFPLAELQLRRSTPERTICPMTDESVMSEAYDRNPSNPPALYRNSAHGRCTADRLQDYDVEASRSTRGSITTIRHLAGCGFPGKATQAVSEIIMMPGLISSCGVHLGLFLACFLSEIK